MEKLNQKFLDVINSAIKVIEPINENLKGKEFEVYSLEFLSATNLTRILDGLKNTRLLYLQIENEKNVLSGISLILRPLFLDLLTISYLADKQFKLVNREGISDETRLKVKKIFGPVISDNINYYIKEQNSYLDYNVIKKEEYKEIMNLVYHQFKPFFKFFRFGNPKVEYEFNFGNTSLASPKEMYKKLIHSENTEFKTVANCYVYYSIYSKYEHFGFMTYHLFTLEIERFQKIFKEALWFILYGIRVSLGILDFDFSEIEKIQNSLREE